MPEIKTHFVESDSCTNVLLGPITFPNPGPTLANDVAAPDNEVRKSLPRNDKIKVIKIYDIINIKKYPITEDVIDSEIGTLLYLATRTPCGFNNLKI